MATFFWFPSISEPISEVTAPGALPVRSKVMVAIIPLPLPVMGLVPTIAILMGLEGLVAFSIPLTRLPSTTCGLLSVLAS